MITIMTPAYNRAYILEKAYLSLKNQTSYEFEWMIIDDGSSDDTGERVKEWIKECTEFEIRYHKQPNGGKHRAVNRAVQMARYDWFLILDSDDQLMANAVELIHDWIAGVAGLRGIAGVAGLKGAAGQAIGGRPEYQYVDATNLERKKFGLLGDKAEIYKTDILKRYPFPEFEGENFIRESAVWDRIAQDGYQLRWYSEVIYLCEYIEDGLTKNTTSETYKNNFNGFVYCSKLFIETHSKLLSLHKCGEFYAVAKQKNIKIPAAANMLHVNSAFFRLGILCFQGKRFIKPLYSRLRQLGRKQS